MGRMFGGLIGVSENLIAASWDALVDSLERGMQGGKPSSVVDDSARPEARSAGIRRAVQGSGPADRISNRRGPEDGGGGAGASDLVPLAQPVIGGGRGGGCVGGAALWAAFFGASGWGVRAVVCCSGWGGAWGVPSAVGRLGCILLCGLLGWRLGNEAITSPFSFVASGNAAVYEGARPVSVHINPVTLNLDPGAAEAAVTSRTRAILPVQIPSHPADMVAFEGIAGRHGLGIVEDACEALGGVHGDGAGCGGAGHPAVFGFMRTSRSPWGRGGW